MLKLNFPLFPELNKLRNLGCCLDVSLIGHDGNVSIHLPVLVAANPWVGDSIDHRDSVHVIMMPDYSVMELESCVEKLLLSPRSRSTTNSILFCPKYSDREDRGQTESVNWTETRARGWWTEDRSWWWVILVLCGFQPNYPGVWRNNNWYGKVQ